MPQWRHGRFLGLAWCCTVDPDGVENDVAFGLTRRRAEQRCARRNERRLGRASSPHDGLISGA